MFGKPVGKLGAVGGRTLIQRVISILRRFGPDAHIYLPGVGMLNGLQAGNHLDSAGTTRAEIDGPVGLVLDAAGGLGVELIDNSVGVLGSSFAIRCSSTAVGGGFYSVTANDALVAALATPDALITFGKTYKVILEISGVAGGIVNLHLSSSQNSGLVSTPFLTRNSIGVFEAIVTPDVATRDCITALCGASGQAITFKVTVREVTGIAATQPTTASKPILRRDAGGRYYWQFDGSNDSLSLGGPLFQMADDHCVVAGVGVGATGSVRPIFGAYSAASNNPRMQYYISDTGRIVSQYRSDGGVAVTATITDALTVGSTFVGSMRKTGVNIFVRANGVQSPAINSASITPITVDSFAIGETKGSYSNGAIYPVIAIKGTVPDSDLLLLEKFVGQLSGVQI